MLGRRVTTEELQRHNTLDDVWLVVEGNVYDMTDFAPSHPGGSEIIYQHGGSDATVAYSEIHAPNLIRHSLDASKHVGFVDAATVKQLTQSNRDRAADMKPTSGIRPPTTKPALSEIINLFDFAQVAQQFLTPKTLAHVEGGANDCVTHRNNRSVWEKVALRPHLLVDVARVDTRARMLGHDFELPVFTSPFGLARLTHPDGELSIAKAAVDCGVTMCYSTYASFPFADTVDVVPRGYPLFFQLYVNKDRRKTERMLKEVAAAGAKALFITVDLPVVGKREADERIKAQINERSGNAQTDLKDADKKGGGLARATASDIDPSFSWKDLAWIKSITSLPIILKGIQTAADAKKAMLAGCDGIFISNHGGRALDTSPASLLVLLEMHLVCPEVFDKMEVFFDGGIRRGSDILKAICLGATGVGLGRSVLYSNMYGVDGVKHLFWILKDELETAMQQCGLTSLRDASPKYINTAKLDHLVMKNLSHPYARKVYKANL